uniref:zinc finger CCCH domain-containing protein 3-like isoform X2 n=1 Tax=Styela clava TaxID=7725 RepID=UPI00193A225C|nr:zinc finger CCCH domain-containing protein 3-like isoform X2 [Styela clava]
MSHADRLREEIKYLSVLIQQHKEGKKYGEADTGKQQSAIETKYRWKSLPESTNIQYIPRQYPDQKKKHHQSHASYVPKKKPYAKVPPTPDMMANKTGVKFQSKFKWSKGTGSVSQSTSGTMSLQDSTVKTADFAVAKSASQIAHLNIPMKKFIPTAKTNLRKKASEKKVSIQNSQKIEVGVRSPINNSNIRQQPMTSGKGALNKQRNVLSRIPSQQSHHKWSPKRRSSTYFKVPHSTSKWTAKRVQSNPYKLNRVASSQHYINHRKSNTLKLSKNTSKLRNHTRVLDHGHKPKELSSHITLSKAALEGLLKKHSVTLKQVLANRAVVRSHKTARFNKERKKQHCLYFGRFGKCMRGDRCNFIHDPSRVVVCTRFLRGTCRNDKCSFSHKVQKEKIPVCLFFLRGKCSVVNCPYLHVYLGKEAPVCRRFATTGFCQDADKCKMQHIKCCPEFYESASCSRGKSCQLQHLKIHKHRSSNEFVSAQTSSCPDFLSLNVDSPQPINKPFKSAAIHIKPRFGKLKLDLPSSQ